MYLSKMRASLCVLCSLVKMKLHSAEASIKRDANTSKYSLIVVLTDDQDARINGYNESGVAHMPQLNSRVASRGAVFSNYVVAYPLCSPSRSTMLTGQFTHNTQFYSNLDINASKFHPDQESRTINTWFQAQGYATMLCGKYMNGYHANENAPNNYSMYIPTGWSDWYALQSMDYYGPRMNMNGLSILFSNNTYQTDLLAQVSAAWIDSKIQSDTPFFTLITPHAPHDPQTPPVRYDGTLEHLVTIPQDASFNQDLQHQQLLPGIFAQLPLQNATLMQQIATRRAECLLAIDDLVGSILDVLLLDHEDPLIIDHLDTDTFFFYASDNGYHLAHHRLPPGKREIFDHDVRLPLIVAGPGISSGTRIQLVANYDLTPTWAALCNVPILPQAPIPDGRSFASALFDNNTTNQRSFVLQESWGTCEDSLNGIKCSGRNQSSTTPDYIGLFSPDNFTFALFKDGSTMYFDNLADYDQHTNVVGNLTNSTLAALLSLVSTYKDCVGATKCP